MKRRDRENLNPTPAAVVAMHRYGAEYAAQSGGSMDFWDKLDYSRKRLCQDTADRVIEAACLHGMASRDPKKARTR